MSHSAKPLRAAPDIVRDIMRLRDHLWDKVRGRGASDDLAWVAMHINSALYGSLPALPAGWNYDLSDIPTNGERFLGLWHRDGIDDVQIIWHAGKSLADLRFLSHAENEAPHYVRDPHAYALLPQIKRPQ